MADGLSAARTLGLIVLATFIAPAFAPAVGMFILAVLEGDPAGALLMVPLMPLLLLTIPGIYGYSLALVATLVLGLPLTAAAFAIPSLRRVRIWLAVGAAGGALLGLLFTHDVALALVGGVAGAISALVYRWIVGYSFKTSAIEQTA